MKISGEITGVREVNVRIIGMTDRIRAEIAYEMEYIVADLVQHITRDKLSGQVLDAVSGRLRGSIGGNVQTAPDGAVVGTAYSSGVPYARIQEYGGVTPAHLILPRSRKMLHFFGSDGTELFLRRVNHPGSRIPARSFMGSALLDMRGRVLQDLYDAVIRGLHK